MKNIRVSGIEKKNGPRFMTWTGFIVIFLLALLFVLMAEWYEGDRAYGSANELCGAMMNEDEGQIGLRSGWWEMEAIVRQGDIIHVTCKYVNITSINSVG